MKMKLYSIIAASLILTGCASKAPHQYDNTKSLALNVSRAAEISEEFEDSMPSNELVEEIEGRSTSIVSSAIRSRATGRFIGFHMLGSYASNVHKTWAAQQHWAISSTALNNEDSAGLKIAHKFASAIQNKYPDTVVADIDNDGFKTTGGACVKQITREVELGYIDAVQSPDKQVCKVRLHTELLSKADTNIFAQKEQFIIRTLIAGDYPAVFFAALMDDSYFYIPPAKYKSLSLPPIIIKQKNIYPFTQPVQGVDITIPATELPYWKEAALL